MVPLETHSERWSSTRAPECVLNHHHYRLQLWQAALRADHSHSHSHFRAKPLRRAHPHCLLWGAKENQNAETQMQFHRRDAKKIPVFSSGTNGRHCVVCTVCKAGTYSVAKKGSNDLQAHMATTKHKTAVQGEREKWHSTLGKQKTWWMQQRELLHLTFSKL